MIRVSGVRVPPQLPTKLRRKRILKEGSWARSTANDDGDGAVRQHLEGLAAECGIRNEVHGLSFGGLADGRL
jgi:hypothetical protein